MPSISKICHWLCRNLIILLRVILYLLFSLFHFTTRFTKSIFTAQSDRQQLVLDNDLSSVFSVLDAGSNTVQPITYLQSVESVLADAMRYTTAVDFSRKHWLDITWRINAIRALLRDYYCDLERAAHLPGHHHAGVASNFERFAPHLKELCLSMKHAILVLQRCRNDHKLHFWNMILWNDVRQCCHEIHRSLDNLNECLLPKTIYETSLSKSYNHRKPLHIMRRATPERYRLVDCSQLDKNNGLCIKEFIHFPLVPYAAVSYVWHGNAVPQDYSAPEFSIAGAEEADPIGVEVLRYACKAALAQGAAYLWINHLCVMQANEDDKDWQIRRMYDIYSSCVTCIVIPGGLRRLVSISKETMWIHRGWTLQEALAPSSAAVLVAWRLGKGRVHSRDGASVDVQEVVPRRSALMPLSLLLDACATGHLSFESEEKTQNIDARLFCSQVSKHMDDNKPSSQQSQRAMSPNVAALSLAMSKCMNPDLMQYAIWKSALMRTTSRPVDMVFSIMGLFGVSLDTKAFHKNDRIGATIALARQILQKGGRANWLGVSFRVAPCRHLSTFPTFPRASTSGKAFVRMADGKHREVSELSEKEYRIASVFEPMSQGSMDMDGYHTLNAKALRVVPAPIRWISSLLALDLYTAMDGSAWTAYKEGMTPSSSTFAVLLGKFSGSLHGVTPVGDNSGVQAMIIEEHAPGKYHVRSYFLLTGKSEEWVAKWTEHSFCVGGPDTRKGDEVSED